MKQVVPNIDFADASYKSCKSDNNDLIVYFNSWDDKILRITFSNAIQFFYKEGSFIEGIYEKTDDSSFLAEALSSYYEKIPEIHLFKMFVIVDIDEHCFFKVVAEKISASKELPNLED